MNANFVSYFLHLDLNDDGVEDDIQCNSNSNEKMKTSVPTEIVIYQLPVCKD